MRKHRNALARPAPGLTYLDDVAAYKPNRAALRSPDAVGWGVRAVIATRSLWARAVSYLLTGTPGGAA